MLTTFGKRLRKLRIMNGELMRDMAAKLNVTASYLSGVETGKRLIPDGWVDRISDLYSLSPQERRDLQKSAGASAPTLKPGPTEFTGRKHQTVVLFARELCNVDDEKLETIRRLLKAGDS